MKEERTTPTLAEVAARVEASGLWAQLTNKRILTLSRKADRLEHDNKRLRGQLQAQNKTIRGLVADVDAMKEANQQMERAFEEALADTAQQLIQSLTQEIPAEEEATA